METVEDPKAQLRTQRGEQGLPTLMTQRQASEGTTKSQEGKLLEVDARYGEILDQFPKVASTALQGRKVVVLGGGVSGQAAADKALEAGAEVVITDSPVVKAEVYQWNINIVSCCLWKFFYASV